MKKVVKYGIEIVVILVILLAALYGITKINTSLTRTNQQKVLITFEAQNLEAELLSKMESGDKITDNAKTTYLGEIISLSEQYPYTKSVKNYDTNSFMQVEVPNRFNRDITVAVMADVTDSSVMVGETELKIGYTIPLINEKYMVNSIITNIELSK
ncbi:MAG: DUF4330 family protein [Clostridia bacterium]|nr:DUF4330 family protein [Clostridia bacterium]